MTTAVWYSYNLKAIHIIPLSRASESSYLKPEYDADLKLYINQRLEQHLPFTLTTPPLIAHLSCNPSRPSMLLRIS